MTDDGVYGGDRFPTTRASAVLGAASADPAERARSIELLAEAYWKPVYKYTRLRWRRDPEEAREITQDFFAHALDKETFAAYRREQARFRTFLRTCLDRYVIDRVRAESAAKRGGGMHHIALEFDGAESELASADVATLGPLDEFFENESIRHILSLAVERLRGECEAKGKSAHFAVFSHYHLGDDERSPSYSEIAAARGMSVHDVTNRLSYARREFRRIVLDTLRGITADDDEFRDEARAVLGVVV